jgi:hypothetical protein
MRTFKQQRVKTAILATARIALAFLCTLCGAGGTVAIAAIFHAPAVTLSPVSLSFPGQAIGTSSGAQSVTLSNTSRAVLAISRIVASGDFGQTNNCGTSVARGNKCTISVTFTPTATGVRTGAVTITYSGSRRVIGLSGTGTSTAPVASLSPTSLPFGNQAVSTTSAARTGNLRNTGGAVLTITSIAVTGANASDFVPQTNNCGSSLAVGANCTIVVSFTPSAIGNRAASMSITDNASGSPHTVSLSGAGIHYVALSWTASATSGVVGYNVYRGTALGGPYPTQLNSSPIDGATYADATVVAGQTYYYVATAVASDGATESANSNEASAVVPSP